MGAKNIAQAARLRPSSNYDVLRWRAGTVGEDDGGRGRCRNTGRHGHGLRSGEDRQRVRACNGGLIGHDAQETRNRMPATAVVDAMREQQRLGQQQRAEQDQDGGVAPPRAESRKERRASADRAGHCARLHDCRAESQRNCFH